MDRFLDFVAWCIEFANWIRIILSPFFVSIIVGGIVYLNIPDWNGVIFALVISLIGLIIGIIWATRIWKSEGTTHFVARVYASPDIDEAVRPKEETKISKDNSHISH